MSSLQDMLKFLFMSMTGPFFFLRMEISLRVACFVYCRKARTITTHESQQMKHSEALACKHDTTA